MPRPKDAEDFIRLIDRWFETNDIDELDQCSFLAVWMGKLLFEMDEGELRQRFSYALIKMIGMSNDSSVLATLPQRMDH